MKTAIVPGTFDPISLGHVDIVERGLKIFDRLIIAVAESSQKKTLFTLDERKAMIAETFEGRSEIRIEPFSGLLVDLSRKVKANFVLRGLRTVSDFEYENQMAAANRFMDNDLVTIFMMTDRGINHLSSSLIREIASLGGSVNGMVPGHVEKKLHKKFGRTS